MIKKLSTPIFLKTTIAMAAVFLVATVLFLVFFNRETNCADCESLVLVHSIFRHGERTPDGFSTFPSDPYKNETYFPIGPGRLTKKGKRNLYQLGQYYRKRYNSFLGSDYHYDIVDSVTSNYDRTKMSLELVHAGLFPPSFFNRVNYFLNWQPVPFDVNPKMDKIFIFVNCPDFVKSYSYLVENDYKEYLDKYADKLEFLTENTGNNISHFLPLYLTYDNLVVKEQMGIKLPEWSSSVYPEFLKMMASKFYELFKANKDIKQATAGTLLTKMINDSMRKINGTIPRTKMFLYSGHDVNVGAILTAMGHVPLDQPEEGSAVMLELHKIEDVYGFKVYYKTRRDTILLEIENCGSFCPLDQFMVIMDDYLTESEDPVCLKGDKTLY